MLEDFVIGDWQDMVDHIHEFSRLVAAGNDAIEKELGGTWNSMLDAHLSSPEGLALIKAKIAVVEAFGSGLPRPPLRPLRPWPLRQLPFRVRRIRPSPWAGNTFVNLGPSLRLRRRGGSQNGSRRQRCEPSAEPLIYEEDSMRLTALFGLTLALLSWFWPWPDSWLRTACTARAVRPVPRTTTRAAASLPR